MATPTRSKQDGGQSVGLNGDYSRPETPLTPFLHIAQMMNDCLAQKRIDLVDFVNQLLVASPAAGWKCTRETDRLVLESAGHRMILPGEPRALSIVRSICARLAVLSHETTGCEPFLYGGAGEINYRGHVGPMAISYKVATMNTAGQQWFEIHPVPEAAR